MEVVITLPLKKTILTSLVFGILWFGVDAISLYWQWISIKTIWLRNVMVFGGVGWLIFKLVCVAESIAISRWIMKWVLKRFGLSFRIIDGHFGIKINSRKD